MKKIYLLILSALLCLCCTQYLNGQEITPAIKWQQTLGGVDTDNLFAIIPTPDQGYILGGQSNSGISGEKTAASKGVYDYWIVKLDSTGAIEWQKTIGGTDQDMLTGISLCAQGGYIVSGMSRSGIGGDKTDTSRDDPAFAAFIGGDVWLLRLSDSGNILWQKTYGGLYVEGATQVAATADGGFIVGTSSASGISGDKTEINRTENNASLSSLYFIFGDYWIFKLDASGNMQWQKTLGGEDNDQFSCIRQTPDGGYIVGGTSESFFLTNTGTAISGGDKTDTIRGKADYWILKLNATGGIQWQKTIGGSDEDRLMSIDLTSDGGYILGGYSSSGISGEKTDTSKGTYDYWILKLNGTGAIQWQKTIGGNGADLLSSVRKTMDGGYLVSGASASSQSGDKLGNGYGGLTDFWLLKLNATGSILWQKTLGGMSNNLDHTEMPADFWETADNGYIVAGTSDSWASGTKTDSCRGSNDYWILKLERCAADTTFASASFCGQSSYILPDGTTVLVPGTYYSVLSGASGCDSVVVTNLGQAIPAATVTLTGNTLAVNPVPGATYQWFSCSTLLPVAGATNTTFQPATAGYYAVAVDLNGCADTSMCYNVTPTGIHTIDQGTELIVYPNPATDFIFLQTRDRDQVVEKVSLTELATGRTLRTETFGKNIRQRYRMSLAGILPGSYLLNIQTATSNYIRRVQILR